MTNSNSETQSEQDDLNIYRMVSEAVSSGSTALLAIVIENTGSSPGRIGFKAFITPDQVVGTVGGGVVEARVIEAARKILADTAPQPTIMRFKLEAENTEAWPTCGGEMVVYLEPIGFFSTVYLFGAGHVGLATAPLLQKIGFRIVVCDDRVEFANAQRFPMAAKIYAQPFDKIMAELHPTITKRDFIVIFTRGHLFDEEVLQWAVTTDAGYIGMIGSDRKVALILENLRSKGVRENQLARVTAPIGIPIGSRTPFEVAVSITAQLIAIRRNIDHPMRSPQGDPA